MKHSLIVTAAEGSAIREGKQTAFVELVKSDAKRIEWTPVVVGKHRGYCDEHGRAVPCPYAIGQAIYLREPYRHYHEEAYDDDPIIEYAADGDYEPLYENDGDGFQVFNKDGSERMIPWRLTSKKNARTFPKVVDVKCVRAQDVDAKVVLGIDNINDYQLYYDYIIAKFGQSAWDDNAYLWLIKIEV